MKPKGYTISRIAQTEETDGDPFAQFEFIPSKDSDKLFDALRTSYPGLKTYKDRLFRAVVDFCSAEKLQEKAELDTALISTNDEDALMASKTSPRVQLPLDKGIQSMLGTFSAVPDDSRQKKKRSMTAKEREEYRVIKRIGACDLCRKRKRKCNCKLRGAEKMVTSPKRTRIAKKENRAGEISLKSKRHFESPVLKSDGIEPAAQTESLEERRLEGQETAQTLSAVVKSTPSWDLIDTVTGCTPNLSDWSSSQDWDLARSPFYISEDMLKSPLLSPPEEVDNWAQGFELSPQITLGDLAMSGWEDIIPSRGEDRWTRLDTAASLSCIEEHPSVADADADADIVPESTPVQTITRQHPLAAVSLGYPVDDYAAAVDLILRANAALAPFAKFADDAQFLIQELRNLRLQLKLLRKPPVFLSKSTQYYTTVRDVALDIQAPLQSFVDKLQPTRDLHYLERLGLNLTSTAFQIRKLRWDKVFREESKRLRSMISTRTTTISLLMTLTSMETLTEIHTILHSNSSDLQILKERLLQRT